MPYGNNARRSEHYGALQVLVDALFSGSDAGDEPGAKSVTRLEVLVQAESLDLPDDLQEIVRLLPPGTYRCQRLCDQLNSALNGHAWGQRYGTVQVPQG